MLAAFWVPLAICLGVAVTPDPTGMVASLSGMIAHIFAFAYLTVALFQAHFPWNGDASPARCVWAAVLWMLAFGVAIEVAQLFVAGRSGDLADLLPDGVGIAIGCIAQSGWAWFSFRQGDAQGAPTSLAAKTPSAP